MESTKDDNDAKGAAVCYETCEYETAGAPAPAARGLLPLPPRPVVVAVAPGVVRTRDALTGASQFGWALRPAEGSTRLCGAIGHE